MLAVLVPMLRRDGDLTDNETDLLVRISAATIDRRLAPERAKMMSRRRSQTKPGTLLKSQIPIRTWADWDDAVPGFVEIDLIGHEGGNSSGEFCFTLTVTDIATGWTVNRSVQNEAEKWVFGALQHVMGVFPFPIIGIDSDNGSEFINHHLFDYRMDNKSSRSRPQGHTAPLPLALRHPSEPARLPSLRPAPGIPRCSRISAVPRNYGRGHHAPRSTRSRPGFANGFLKEKPLR